MSYDLGAKMRIGAVWAYIQTGGVMGLQFMTGVILARLLEPADFGVFVAVTAYTAILSAQISFGLPQALLQTKSIEPKQISACFWLMETIAVISTVIAFSGSHLLESIYDDSRYADLMMLTCVNFFLTPYIFITSTLLRREMNFKSLSQIRIAATLISAIISIALAAAGLGPTSLALGGIVASATTALLLAYRQPWTPSLHSLRETRPLLSYAWSTNINQTLTTLIERADNMLIGALLNTAMLGLYNRAYSLARLPVDTLAVNLHNLLFGGLSRVQENIEHTRQMFGKALCSMATLVFPFLTIFLFVGDEFLLIVYGEKWLPAAEPLKVMTIGAFATLISIAFRSLNAAQNLVKKEVKINIAGLILTAALVAALAPFGLAAIAGGIALREIVLMLSLKAMLRRSHLHMRWHFLLHTLAPPAIATLIAALGAYLAGHIVHASFSTTPVGQLLAVSLSFFSIYIAVIIAFWRCWSTHVHLDATVKTAAAIFGRLPGMARLIPR